MRKISVLFVASAAVALSGCAEHATEDFPSGPDQVVNIRTEPAMSAKCMVSNPRSAWDIASTPQYLDISRARGALEIKCSNSTGWVGDVIVTSKVSAVGVATALVTGAAAAGITAATTGLSPLAIVGVGVGTTGAVGGLEMLDGTAYRYPTDIVVPMNQVDADVPDAMGYPLSRPKAMMPVPVVATHHHLVQHHHVVRAHCSCSS